MDFGVFSLTAPSRRNENKPVDGNRRVYLHAQVRSYEPRGIQHVVTLASQLEFSPSEAAPYRVRDEWGPSSVSKPLHPLRGSHFAYLHLQRVSCFCFGDWFHSGSPARNYLCTLPYMYPCERGRAKQGPIPYLHRSLVLLLRNQVRIFTSLFCVLHSHTSPSRLCSEHPQ